MIILDTDCISLLQRENVIVGSNLQRNLDKFSPEEICTSIISFEEQMRGWLSFVSKSRTPDQQIFAYSRLHAALKDYKNSTVLDFDDKAAKIFVQLKSDRIRIGTMDLKIASIAIANQAILISRNLSDFEQVPNLSVKDWTQ
ncbi:MAG TPA: type II toxin-antitoxin system VapC family toxin [Pyrinomonadaceae bacterium]|nr:type II toxin-antitoxin system VapC family toxin [Pyrinomonadaceae bacterium]